MKTLISNLKHAARNQQSVSIGGGEFSADEIQTALSQFEALKAAALQALDALQWDIGGEPLPTSEIAAAAALRSALRAIDRS